MAPLPETLQSSPLAKLRAVFSKEKDDPFMFDCKVAEQIQGRHAVNPGTVPAEPRQWRGFEFADFLEQGMGPGLETRYVEPVADDHSTEERHLVRAGDNPGSYTLTTAHGLPLLSARANEEGSAFDVFLACDGEAKVLGPSFRLESSQSLGRWVLHSVRCHECESRGIRNCGARELCRMTQYFERVGEGQAFCMDVELPKACEDGSPGRCKVCGGQPLQEGPNRLTTLRPKWNPAHKSLALNFYGRVSVASAKNFQLQDRLVPCAPGKPQLLFGQVDDKAYVLDYRHPFGAVQAFATALTASHWL